MSIHKILFSSLFLTSLVFVSPVLAGGGPISFRIEPNDRTLNPGEQYIVHLEVYADGPNFPTYCKSCFVKLALQNPQANDYIAQSSEKTDENGRLYAKVISKVPGPRTIYASELVDSSGKIITSNSSAILKYSGEPAIEIPTSELTETKEEVSPVQAPQIVVPTPVEDNSQINELNQKVENLQNQLEASNQRQSFLETRLNLIISWIKSILPFIN